MAENNQGNDAANRLGNLAAMLQQGSGKGHPPVETWNPPYCGDIGLEIKADGTWCYRGSPINRPALVRLFASVLRKDVDGKTYLVTPDERVDVAVADAPFLAVEMELTGHPPHQELVFRTNVDDVVPCGPAHPLRFAVDEKTGAIKPYLRVRGRLEALVTRALTHELLNLAVDTEPVGIRSGGILFLIPDAPVFSEN
ncbi:MAG: DUF1285 domain-containing protein [Hyphomicrobium sp.]|jgi:hypothetical protein|nr:DUF1285 domain-containing protein [Hyphomicrobium sp.]PPD06607.1 MAG: hypothetical protein CTY28_12640 [Hyphomicrobium sp.]